MSTYVLGSRAFDNGDIDLVSSFLTYHVMKAGYVYNPSHEMNQINAQSSVSGSLSGRNITGTDLVSLTASNPRFTDGSDELSGVVIADSGLNVPIAYISTDKALSVLTKMVVRWNPVLKYLHIYGFRDWITKKYRDALKDGYEDRGALTLSRILSSGNRGAVNTFSVVKEGKIKGFSLTSQFYELALEGVSNDVNPNHTQDLVEIDSGAVNTFSLVSLGKIHGFSRPTVEAGDGNIDYSWSEDFLVPRLKVTRLSETQFSIDTVEEYPAPYQIRIFRSADYGYFNGSQIADIAVGTLPYTDTVDRLSNPKYYAYLYIDGEINDTPVESRGKTSPPVMEISQGNRL